jgi:hypothetical protein
MMAMDGDVLGLTVAAVLIGKSTVPPTPEMIMNIQQFWKDVCGAYVDHVQSSAEVPMGIPLAAGAYAGATTGPGKVI